MSKYSYHFENGKLSLEKINPRLLSIFLSAVMRIMSQVDKVKNNKLGEFNFYVNFSEGSLALNTNSLESDSYSAGILKETSELINYSFTNHKLPEIYESNKTVNNALHYISKESNREDVTLKLFHDDKNVSSIKITKDIVDSFKSDRMKDGFFYGVCFFKKVHYESRKLGLKFPTRGLISVKYKQAQLKDVRNSGSKYCYFKISIDKGKPLLYNVIPLVLNDDSLIDNHEKKVKLIEHIISFSKLKTDWDGYGGNPIFQSSIVTSQNLIRYFYQLKSIHPMMSYPEVFPIANGGIQIEWESENKYIQIEVVKGKISLFSQIGKFENEIHFEKTEDVLDYIIKLLGA